MNTIFCWFRVLATDSSRRLIFLGLDHQTYFQSLNFSSGILCVIKVAYRAIFEILTTENKENGLYIKNITYSLLDGMLHL